MNHPYPCVATNAYKKHAMVTWKRSDHKLGFGVNQCVGWLVADEGLIRTFRALGSRSGQTSIESGNLHVCFEEAFEQKHKYILHF
jgi:hypothetical protein